MNPLTTSRLSVIGMSLFMQICLTIMVISAYGNNLEIDHPIEWDRIVLNIIGLYLIYEIASPKEVTDHILVSMYNTRYLKSSVFWTSVAFDILAIYIFTRLGWYELIIVWLVSHVVAYYKHEFIHAKLLEFLEKNPNYVFNITKNK